MFFSGEFTKREMAAFQAGERSDIIRHADNLQVEGADFTKRAQPTWQPGDRAQVVKRADNLAMEGEFQKQVRIHEKLVSRNFDNKSSHGNHNKKWLLHLTSLL